MSTPKLSVTPRKRRTAWVIGLAIVAVVIVVLLLLSFTNGSARTGGSEDVADPAATVTTSAAAPTVTDSAATSTDAPGTESAAPGTTAVEPPAPVLAAPMPPADADAAVVNVQDFLAAKASALATPVSDPTPEDFEAVATGSAFDTMMANSEEFSTNGWHQEGAPTVVSVTVTGYEPDATPPQATLNVCVDSAKVNVLTADGDIVKQGTAADRTVNILTVVLSGDKWLVSRESLPADPNC